MTLTATPNPALPTPTPALPTPTPALPTPTPALPTPTPATPAPTPSATPVDIIVNPTTGLTTTEGGGQATFNVRLNGQPTADVKIDLGSSNTPEGTVSPVSLTFNSANWNAAQTVTVTGVDDSVANGNKAYTIVTSPAVSNDSKYSGLNAADVAVTNTDNETLWCGLEKGLDQLENIVNDQLNAFKLPILGGLSDIFPNFISNLKNNLVNTVKNATDFTPSQLENSIQEIVGSAFDVKV